MTSTNSAGVSFTVLLLALCLRIALTSMGGWYFQSSLFEVKEQQQEFQVLNQARAGHRPARAWFLKIDPVRIVCMRACVCVSAPEAINN